MYICKPLGTTVCYFRRRMSWAWRLKRPWCTMLYTSLPQHWMNWTSHRYIYTSLAGSTVYKNCIKMEGMSKGPCQEISGLCLFSIKKLLLVPRDIPKNSFLISENNRNILGAVRILRQPPGNEYIAKSANRFTQNFAGASYFGETQNSSLYSAGAPMCSVLGWF